jgi:hypothetical protein
MTVPSKSREFGALGKRIFKFNRAIVSKAPFSFRRGTEREARAKSP